MTSKKPAIHLATALRAGMKGYGPQRFRQDAIAGLIVSLVALPLSMALSIAVGLPPENGLYTAIIAGTVAAVLGGSMAQVSGPTAAFVVIVAPIVRDHGLSGIILCEMMAGAILLLMGVLRLGKLINYVPYPVVTGFTAGIAVTIGTLALNDFFGLGIAHLSGSFIEKAGTIAQNLPHFRLPDLAIGMVTLLSIVFFPKITTRLPAPAVGIALGTALGFILNRYGLDAETLNTRFSYLGTDGLQHPGIPPYPPHFAYPKLPDIPVLQDLFKSALVIAALGALESLLSATVADSMARTHHDPNAELSGIGIANILSGFFSGIPATGAIARTAANIQAGARTPVAAVLHAALILIYMVTLAAYIGYIPMAALAALLMTVAWRMSHLRQCVRIIRLAPRSDTVVLLTCFTLTVLIDMVAGVSVGMIMAAMLFMMRISELTKLQVTTAEKPTQTHGPLPHGTMIYQIEGPLFFGSVNKTLEGADYIPADITRLIIDLEHVPMIDVTGMMGMKTFLSTTAHEGRQVYLCGDGSVTHRIEQKIAGESFARFVSRMPHVSDALKA